MSAISNNGYKDGVKPSFWKKGAKSVPGSIKPVYGAQHPPMKEPVPIPSGPTTPTKKDKSGRPMRDAFQDFQDNTIDAWDDTDDDLMVSDIRLSRRDVHSTAMQVLNNHSQQMSTPPHRTSNNSVPVAAAAAAAAAAWSQDTENSSLSTSAPCTPAHQPPAPNLTPRSAPAPPPAIRPGGPGVGVRLNTHWQIISPVTPAHVGQMPVPDRESSKLGKFRSLLEADNLDLDEFRKVSWSGVPPAYRPLAWKILSGYIPPILDRRQLTLRRKREEYYNFLEQYLETRHQEIHQHTFRQIQIDIPRMSPLIALFQQKVVQEIFERILYIWAIRHPASGYVQGINDLVTPFFVVFLTEYINSDVDVNTFEVSRLDAADLRQLEADSFWCFSKLLDGIQDNYTFAQPGIQMRVKALLDLTSRIDESLHAHLGNHNIEYLQFSFRWMNNLLMREIPLHCVIHLWDTYLAEPDGFAHFHLYVCAAFLTKFSKDLQREKDFQGLMIMLQNLPTQNWTKEDIGLLVAEAFKLKYMFADAPSHLSTKNKGQE